MSDSLQTLPPLIKPCALEGPNGLWVYYNNHPYHGCSPDGYALSLTPPKIARLDDMNAAQENEFWDFTFQLAANGIHNPDGRGSADARPARANVGPCPVFVALNDGISTWQTVGSVHGHVVWTAQDSNLAGIDLEETMTKERSALCGGEDGYYPEAAIEIVLTPENSGHAIRAARHALRDNFIWKTSPDFAIYTKMASFDDPRHGASVVVEAWTHDHHSLLSLSNVMRAYTGIRPLSASPTRRGFNYSHFEKMPTPQPS